MEFTLQCNCGSYDFTWDNNARRFTCLICGRQLCAEDAGQHLIATTGFDSHDTEENKAYGQ